MGTGLICSVLGHIPALSRTMRGVSWALMAFGGHSSSRTALCLFPVSLPSSRSRDEGSERPRQEGT